MVNLQRHSQGSCPTLESWCAYLDGSMADHERDGLGEHLATCDRCFSTVVTLREDLAANNVERGRLWPLFRYVAAAAVAIVILGALYWVQRSDAPHPAHPGDLVEKTAKERQFGFAGEESDVIGGSGSVQGLVVLAGTEDDLPENPAWAQDLFDAELDGSVPQLLASRGVTAPLDAIAQARRYRSDATTTDVFVRDILRAVDEELDLSRFDNDGPDGVADSGDDDGIVDYAVVILSAGAVIQLSGASHALDGGMALTYLTKDVSASGRRVLVQIGPSGFVVRETSFQETVEAIANEYETRHPLNP